MKNMSEQWFLNGWMMAMFASGAVSFVLEWNGLKFVYGSDTELIGDMDKAVAGKRAGDQVEVQVSPDQAFGPHDPRLTFSEVEDHDFLDATL